MRTIFRASLFVIAIVFSLLVPGSEGGVVPARDGIAGLLREKGPKGKAALVRIVQRETIAIPGPEKVFCTRLKAEVLEPLHNAERGQMLELFFPGAAPGRYWTSISPPYEWTEPNREVVIFAAENPGLAAIAGTDARWFHFADIFVSVKSSSGERVVLGAGPRAGIESNRRISELAGEVAKAARQLGWKK